MAIVKQFSFNTLLRRLANLKFAIILLFLIGFSIALGTFIEQDQSLIFYKTNYPDILLFEKAERVVSSNLDY